MVAGASVDARIAEYLWQRRKRHVAAEELRAALARVIYARPNCACRVVHIDSRKIMLDVTICWSERNDTRLLVIVDLFQPGMSRQPAHFFNSQRHGARRRRGSGSGSAA
eukprot:6214682-Pleurochrysis_carterae.AAC.2